ncbi:MAG: rhomboid family intrarane serine protease, partial [Arthrobacter sp.]|nr:rhomboid family intrarane serine protease [Arthrobacter sp.]
MTLDSFPDERPRTAETPASRARRGLLVVGSFVLLLYVIEIINTVLFHSLNRTFGLRPRSLDGLLDILTFPLLHANLAHLMSNTLPLIIFGFLVFLAGMRVFVTALASSWLGSG